MEFELTARNSGGMHGIPHNHVIAGGTDGLDEFRIIANGKNGYRETEGMVIKKNSVCLGLVGVLDRVRHFEVKFLRMIGVYGLWISEW